MLRNLIEMQLDKIGFVCPARTLWPIIGNKEKPSIENENFMKSNDIWCQISKEKEMTKSTFYRHISAIKKDSSVSTYALSVKGNKGFAQVEIIGRNPGCQNKAIDFFSKHPEFKKERHSIIHT